MKIDGMTAAQIEAWFREGNLAAEMEAEGTCPYTDKLAVHWWTRGYAYVARLLRAHRAEGKS